MKFCKATRLNRRLRANFSFGSPRLSDSSSLMVPVQLKLELRCLYLSLMDHRLRQYSRFGLRGLRIGASTLALVSLLRSEWAAGAGASLAWFLFVQVERRWTDQSESD